MRSTSMDMDLERACGMESLIGELIRVSLVPFN